MPVTVHLHVSFVNGRLNSDVFKDMPHLNAAEMGLLVDFITKCLHGDSLPGRNKRSWVNDTGGVIPASLGYQQSNVWHYHAGPHVAHGQPKTHNIRDENLGPLTSPAVIHYTWRGKRQQELIVLGFSPSHRPFPPYTDKKNAVRNRARSSGVYDDVVLIDGADLCSA